MQRLLDPDQFHAIFYNLPGALRTAAFRPPPDVCVEVKTLPHAQQVAAYQKLNEVRRERCWQLSERGQRHQWNSESWVIVPMARETKEHFWDAFQLIPMATQDPVRWRNTLQYLKGCPEKPDKQRDFKKSIDTNAGWTSADGARTDRERGHGQQRDRSRSARHGSRRSPTLIGASPKPQPRGREVLRALAESTPPRHGSRRSPTLIGASPKSQPRGREVLRALAESTPPRRTNATVPPNSPDGFATWVSERVKVDVANMTFQSFEVDKKRKLAKKMIPAKALETMPRENLMGDTYKNVYAIYLRKLNQALTENGGKRNAAFNAFKNTANALNIDVSGNVDAAALVKLMARLRALDMTEVAPN